MVSTQIINKTLLSKPLFKEILQLCTALVILQTVVKNPFKYLFSVRSSNKFVVKSV